MCVYTHTHTHTMECYFLKNRTLLFVTMKMNLKDIRLNEISQHKKTITSYFQFCMASKNAQLRVRIG
jgi:hypothetical protein